MQITQAEFRAIIDHVQQAVHDLNRLEYYMLVNEFKEISVLDDPEAALLGLETLVKNVERGVTDELLKVWPSRSWPILKPTKIPGQWSRIRAEQKRLGIGIERGSE